MKLPVSQRFVATANVLPPPAPVVIIQDDDGGQLLAFLDRLAEYRRKGVHVRIEGVCTSACTVVTALPPDQVCVGPDAVLGFHQSFVEKDDAPNDTSARSDQATDYLMKLYPKRLRDWVVRQGGLSERFLVLSGAELERMFRRCEPD
jgi:hypothetical protein